MQQELIKALYETCLMVFMSGIITFIFGLGLGIFLRLLSLNFLQPEGVRTQHNLIKQRMRQHLSKIFGHFLHIAQSLPYVVLMIALLPITGKLLGNESGWWVAILPLSLATIPYFAYHCEKILNTVPLGLIEMMTFMGANRQQIVLKVLLPETLPRIIQAWMMSLAQLVGYSAVAGLLGANGLGSLAIQKGYPEFQAEYIVGTALLLILLIQGLQYIGHYFVKKSLP